MFQIKLKSGTSNIKAFKFKQKTMGIFISDTKVLVKEN